MIRNLVAAKFLKSLPEWNGMEISVFGASQGALQAITLAARDNDISSLEVIVPLFCNLNAENDGYLSGQRPVFSQGLRYFDSVVQAMKLKCPVKIHAGVGDYTCPPSTVMTLYNSIKGEKVINFIQGRTHSYSPLNEEEIFTLSHNEI